MRRFTRKEILARLHEKINRNEPIIIGASGVGIIAKKAEEANIDIIMTYCTGPTRLNGNFGLLAYMGYVDCNGISIDMGNKMLDLVKDTPIVGGIGPADPYRDIDELIDEMMEMGFSGITNVPTVGGHDGALLELLEKYELGFNSEVELIRKCRQKDIFTVAYAFDEEQTRAMVEAGVDVVCPHAGITADKSMQYANVPDVVVAAEKVKRLKEVAYQVNPDVLIACHGGPFVDPESVQEGLRLAKTNIFVGASAIERIPVEEGVYNSVLEYTKITL